MLSPFPGMDPYIEQPALWPGFHSLLAAEILKQLNAVLPDEYYADLEARIEIGVMGLEDPPAFRPDVAVIESPRIPVIPGGASIAAAPLETRTLLKEEMKVTAVRVLRRPEDRLVAVIEILSPINKRKGNSAHGEYVEKREMLLDTPVHLLEIDLLRKGERVPMESALPPAPYFIVLSRAYRRPVCEVWPVQLADPLPVVPVPLLRGDPDMPLDMAKAISDVYDQARYDRRIDYTQPPPGPLTGDEAAWVKQLLKLQL
ncbi:MAG: DUF4058 family protein [Anaerolineae bacterium]|nr:DUF4058 family protein [Anaerolineae bacterium]